MYSAKSEERGYAVVAMLHRKDTCGRGGGEYDLRLLRRGNGIKVLIKVRRGGGGTEGGRGGRGRGGGGGAVEGGLGGGKE